MYSPKFAKARSISDDVAELIKPPRRILVSESAIKHVKVAVPSGSSDWNPEIAPYMVEPMNQLNRRDVEATIFVGPARTGKTQALLDCSIAYAAICDPGDMLTYFPTEANASDFGKRRVVRLHDMSPILNDKLSKRSHDNSIRTVIYRHGMILTLAWPTSSQMAQRDARYVILSDYDSMPQNVGGEGSPFDLAKKRIQAMLSAGSAIAESSPKMPLINTDHKPQSPHEAPPVSGGILTLYNRGHRARWYWQCKECAGWFEAPARPSYDEEAATEEAQHTAFVACPHCGGVHFPKDKMDLQLGSENNHPAIWVPDNCVATVDGEIEGDAPPSTIKSYWVKGCAAAFQSWQSIVNNYVMAVKTYEDTGEEGALKTTTNVDQGMPYLPKSMGKKRSSDELRGRVETWDRGTVPDGVRFLVATTDVQGGSFVNHIHGWGVDGERWLIDRFMIKESARTDMDGNTYPLDPAAYADDWLLLREKVTDRKYKIQSHDGKYMSIRIHTCDSGGKAGVTEKAYNYQRHMKALGYGNRFALVKGSSTSKDGSALLRETFPTSDRKGRNAGGRGDVPVYLLNTLVMKDGLDADLRIIEPGKNFIHIPEWVGEEFFNELESEVRTPKGWVKQSARNEAWDAFVYDKAGLLILEKWMKRRINWESPPQWAANINVNTMVSDGAAKAQQQRPRAKRRVRSGGVKR